MNNKIFWKLFFFMFNCQSFYFNSRTIFCSLLEYNEIFNRIKETNELPTTFNVYLVNYMEMYGVKYESLKQALDFYFKLGFINYQELGTTLTLTVYTQNILDYRDNYLKKLIKDKTQE